MLDRARLWNLAAMLPHLFTGAMIHRAGLEALHARSYPDADRLFDRAAERYRNELRVEAIARLRVHQLIGRLRLGGNEGRGLDVEVERRLYLLRRIERLEPPFDLIDARELLAIWDLPTLAPGRRLRFDVTADEGLRRAA